MGKRSVLLTNISVAQYSGSELDTLQTANWFLQNGWDVEVATLMKNEPLMSQFEKAGIRVALLPTDALARERYDLLWGHHWPVINHVVLNRLAGFKKVAHFCLGPKEELESALPYHEHVSAYFAISEEVKASLAEIDGVDADRLRLFLNSASLSFFERYRDGADQPLKRICVVSNHIPEEVGRLQELLTSRGITVDYAGAERGCRLVDADFLKSYDLIITIGRTVQQCFACGVPVYCYDYCGGPGYIDETNIEAAEWHNFSGRGFNRTLSAEQLTGDLCSRYPQARRSTAKLHDIALKRYCFETNMKANLEYIDASADFDGPRVADEFRRYKRPNYSFVWHWNHEQCIPGLRKELSEIRRENEALKAENEAFKAEMDKKMSDRKVLNERIHELEEQLRLISNSRSYRFARKLSGIYGKFKPRA